MHTVVDVAGPADQVIHVTLNEIHRLPALTGRILDPDDRPVKNAHVYLYKGESEKRDRLACAQNRCVGLPGDVAQRASPVEDDHTDSG